MNDEVRIPLRAYLDERFATLIERIEKIERKLDERGPKAATWGGIGSAIGAAVVVVLSYFGIRPPGSE